jgi:tetratricopeptide (TPR) repeat protein
MHEIVELKCPGCGARVQINQKECEYCHSPIIVSSMSDVFSMSLVNLNKYTKTYEETLKENPDNAEVFNSLAMCYLKLGFYDKALENFDKAIEQNLGNPETYLYAAVSILAGRKPFLTPRTEIDKIEQYINAALMLEERGLFRYFQAYIKYDYFKRKFFKTTPTWEECLMQADADGLSPSDVEQLFAILKQDIPSCM